MLKMALPKCVHLPYVIHISLISKIYGLPQLIILYVFLLNWAFSIGSYSSVLKFLVYYLMLSFCNYAFSFNTHT